MNSYDIIKRPVLTEKVTQVFPLKRTLSKSLKAQTKWKSKSGRRNLRRKSRKK